MHAQRPFLIVLGLAALAAGAGGHAVAQELRDSLMPSPGADSRALNDPALQTATQSAAADIEPDTQGEAAEEASGDGPFAAEAAQAPEAGDEADPAQTVPGDRATEEDPYAPLGLRAGSFLLYPSLGLTGGWSSNVDAVPSGGRSGTDYELSPALQLRSDWSRHELSGRVAGTSEFDEDGTTTSLDGELALRLDLVRDLVAELRATYRLAPEDIGDPDLPANAVERPDAESWGGSAALTRSFGDVSVTGSVAYDAYRYDDARLADGSILDNSDREYDETELRLRAGYMPGVLGVFAESGVNRRDYRRRVDDNGIVRGAEGFDALAGVTVARGEVLEGEVGLGYQVERPDDPTLPDVEGLLYRGSLAWRPTALTTVRLEGALTPRETVLEPGAGGVRVATVDLAVEHALRRNLLVTARLGAERSAYVGTSRLDHVYRAGLDVDYRVNRWLSWRAALSHARHDKEGEAADYEDTRVEAGVTVRR